jgi:hypothetical protein
MSVVYFCYARSRLLPRGKYPLRVVMVVDLKLLDGKIYSPDD